MRVPQIMKPKRFHAFGTVSVPVKGIERDDLIIASMAVRGAAQVVAWAVLAAALGE